MKKDWNLQPITVWVHFWESLRLSLSSSQSSLISWLIALMFQPSAAAYFHIKLGEILQVGPRIISHDPARIGRGKTSKTWKKWVREMYKRMQFLVERKLESLRGTHLPLKNKEHTQPPPTMTQVWVDNSNDVLNESVNIASYIFSSFSFRWFLNINKKTPNVFVGGFFSSPTSHVFFYGRFPLSPLHETQDRARRPQWAAQGSGSRPLKKDKKGGHFISEVIFL